jgi:hypothetical protein
LLTIPALSDGFLAHAPLYLPIKSRVHKKYNNTGHVDAMQLLCLFSLSCLSCPDHPDYFSSFKKLVGCLVFPASSIYCVELCTAKRAIR